MSGKPREDPVGAIDFRSLAVFRIGLGSLLLFDLAARARNLTAHYTDGGIMPRGPLLEFYSQPWHLSLHVMGGTAVFEAALFVLAALFAAGLAAGLRTKLCAFASWAMLISLHTRNPLILQGGDVLLRELMFWAMFLPLGARWSLDAAAAPDAAAAAPHRSMAGLGLLVQICFVYWFTVLLKSGDTWRDGTAIQYALAIHQFATPLGRWLERFPELLRALTFSTLAIETFGPFLAFSPVARGPARTAAVLVFWSLHLGMALCLKLGFFPFVCVVAWSVFLPAWFWDRCAGVRPASPESPAPGLFASRWRDGLLLACLAYVFLWNVRTLDFDRHVKWFPRWANAPGDLLRLDQEWSMFAPNPTTEDGWYVIPGKLRDGTQVDLFRDGSPVDWTEPPTASAIYPDERTRKYMMNLWDANNQGHRLYYGRYLCRRWNESHPEAQQLETFEVVYMLRRIQPGGTADPPEKTPIWDHHCF